MRVGPPPTQSSHIDGCVVLLWGAAQSALKMLGLLGSEAAEELDSSVTCYLSDEHIVATSSISD